MRKDLESICRIGAYSAFLAGFFFVCIVICAFFSPLSITTYIASEQYFKDFVNYKPIFITLKWLMLFANMSMIGVVCCFYELRRDESHGLMSWVSIIAIIGFAVGMHQSVQDLSVVPYLASKYELSDPAIKNVILALGVANPSLFILSMGLPGIWFITVSLRALTNPAIPKHLVILGLMWGVGNLLTVVAHSLVIIPLISLVALGALVIAPLWSISEGLFLLKLSKKLPEYIEYIISKKE